MTFCAKISLEDKVTFKLNGKVPASFLYPVIQYVEQLGTGYTPLVLHLNELLKQEALKAEVICAALERVSNIDPRPALGCRMGLLSEPRAFGMVGYLSLSCSNLGEALKKYQLYNDLVAPNMDSKRIEEKGEVEIRWTQNVLQSDLAAEFGVAAFIRYCQKLISTDFPISSVSFTFDTPDKSSDYEQILGCPIKFSQPYLGVRFKEELLWSPVSTSDPYLLNLLDQQATALKKALTTIDDSDEFTKVLKACISDCINEHDISAESVARKLNCSPRSFYRKLSQKNIRFRTFVLDFRIELAQAYLAEPNLSLLEIAMLLGYSEQSSFTRAFRARTNESPNRYRNRILQQESKI